MIFGMRTKEWWKFKKMTFIFFLVQKRLRYGHIFKTSFLRKNVNNFEILQQIFA